MADNKEKELVIEIEVEHDGDVDPHLMDRFSTEIQTVINPILEELESDGRPELMIVLLSAAIQTAVSLGMEDEGLVNIVSSMLEEAREMEEEEEDEEEPEAIDISQLN